MAANEDEQAHIHEVCWWWGGERTADLKAQLMFHLQELKRLMYV